MRDRSDGENGEQTFDRSRGVRTLPVLGAMVATPREQMQAGLSVAAQIMHRRHSTSAGEMSSDDEEPEGSNELAERWNNNVAGMSFRQRSLLEGILSKSPTLHKVADSSSPVPPMPSFPPTVAQRRWPLPQPHAAVPTSAPSSDDSVWRLRPAAAAGPTFSQQQQRPPKQQGARSRSLDSLGTETASGSAPLWRAEAGGIRLPPRRRCVLALVVIPAAAVVAALAAIATPPLWRWPLAAIGAHGGPTGPFGGGLVVPRSGDQRGQHVAAWSDKQRGSTDMDLAQQVLRVLLRGRIRVGDQGR